MRNLFNVCYFTNILTLFYDLLLKSIGKIYLFETATLSTDALNLEWLLIKLITRVLNGAC